MKSTITPITQQLLYSSLYVLPFPTAFQIHCWHQFDFILHIYEQKDMRTQRHYGTAAEIFTCETFNTDATLSLEAPHMKV